jgi:hypothetical protein
MIRKKRLPDGIEARIEGLGRALESCPGVVFASVR